MKILVIDDEYDIVTNLVYLLETVGYEFISAQDGADGINLAKQHLPDLIISDIMMPHVNGYQVLEALRKDPATVGIPFIFLSAKSSRQNIRYGMQLGAEDYITKPFSQDALLAAVKIRLLRQAALKASILMSVSSELITTAKSIRQLISSLQPDELPLDAEVEQELSVELPASPPTVVVVSKKFSLDFGLRAVMVDGREIRLSPRQFKLLRYLIENNGKIVSHKDILGNVWGDRFENDTQYLHVCINQLRQKIEPNPTYPRYILTERGFGYRFRVAED